MRISPKSHVHYRSALSVLNIQNLYAPQTNHTSILDHYIAYPILLEVKPIFFLTFYIQLLLTLTAEPYQDTTAEIGSPMSISPGMIRCSIPPAHDRLTELWIKREYCKSYNRKDVMNYGRISRNLKSAVDYGAWLRGNHKNFLFCSRFLWSPTVR